MKLTLTSKKWGTHDVFIDDDDWQYIKHWQWGILSNDGKLFYVGRTIKIDGKKYGVRLHRFLLGVTDPKIGVDHIDHNPCNNHRNNIRLATHSQNMRNRSPRASCSSGFVGVRRNVVKYERTLKDGSVTRIDFIQWLASIYVDGKSIHLGTFKTPEEAARCRDAASIKYFGEFANLNFPINQPNCMNNNTLGS